MLRVGLVGTGNIAAVHVEALRRLPGSEIVGVADIRRSRAEAFAAARGIARVFTDVEELAGSGAIDVAHVLVPPPAHRPVAESLLRAGIDVFLEKPMAVSAADCEALAATARSAGTALGVNHNFVFHPAHLRTKRLLAERGLGGIRHIGCTYHMPLRQLAARQLGHWMFQAPVNLLLEQAVHPLSQIDDLIGPIEQAEALPAAPAGDAPQVWCGWDIALRGARGSAQLHFAVGESFPAWDMLVLCEDGRIFADYLNNRVAHEAATRWPDFFDTCVKGIALSTGIGGASIRNLARWLGSTAGVIPKSDPFLRSMVGSIDAFQRQRELERVALDGGSGLRLCRICERIAAAVPVAQRNLLPATSVDAPPAEIAVLGGTGFIGRHLVTALVAEGRHITVLARNTENLPPIYSDPHVRLVAGDIGNPDDVRRGIGTAKRVVNLAHGGGGGSRAEIEKALVGGAQVVADVCLELGVERLVFISSIASLFLGNPNEVITGATPVDRNADSRADYARAKAMAEEALLALHRERGLPLCILRPGVVVGADGLAFHSGVGYYNRDRHCLGWNDGRNPLPFVLAEDVAAAIVAALERNTLAGTAYNLVGDVRLSAREYIHELGRALGRDLRYHPQSPLKIYAVEFAKWLVKRAAGRRDAALASLADLRSRGLAAAFDCSDAKRDLGWVPVADRAEFVRRGIAVNAEPA